MKKIKQAILFILKVGFKIKNIIDFIKNPKLYLRLKNLQKINQEMNYKYSSFEVEKILYRKKIIDDVKHIIKLKGSKYIPEDIKNRAEIKAIAEARHHEQMKLYNLKIDLNLKIS